jgi:hypothetical protein
MFLAFWNEKNPTGVRYSLTFHNQPRESLVSYDKIYETLGPIQGIDPAVLMGCDVPDITEVRSIDFLLNSELEKESGSVYDV